MKKLFLYAGVLLFAVACNQKKCDEHSNAAAALSPDAYPYTLKEPYKNWQTGDQQNAVTVLKMLKAWETKNLDECVTYFADTLEINLDYLHSVLPNDSIKSFLQGSYEAYPKDLKIHMQDWESVISADKSEEWVTVWYRQFWTDSKGVADSVDLINDAKIVKGKIASFSEYSLHLPKVQK